MLDFLCAHAIEIVGNAELSGHEAETLCLAWIGGVSGTTLASGLPAFAIMKPSPFATRSSSRERCVFAS